VEIARDAQSLVPQKKEQGSALEGRSMLIVDDSDSARESFGDMLHALGVKVDAVDSGAEALEALAESVYDVVLLDIQMPVMDGIEVARRIRRGRTMNRSVFVVGISAFSTALLPDDDVALFHVTLQKPVRAAQLEEALTRLLQGIV
jgi:CheY-like chemotaxis protein